MSTYSSIKYSGIVESGISVPTVPGNIINDILDLSTGSLFEVTANDQTLGFSNVPTVKDFKIKLSGGGTIGSYVLSSATWDAYYLGSILGLKISSDGTKMYRLGSDKYVYQYTFATPFDITTLSGVYSERFSINWPETTPQSVAFSNDGTKMYAIGTNSDTVFQYTLSTPFDITTTSYANISFGIAAQDQIPSDLLFNNDGTKMYIVGGNSNTVYQYTLSTAYNVSTSSYDNISFTPTGIETILETMTFNNNGTKMYIVGRSSDGIHPYTLSTPYDIGTASYDNINFNFSEQEINPNTIAFNDDGTKIYMSGITNNALFQYTLSTAFDVSTASFNSNKISIKAEELTAQDIAFNGDGTKMYIIGSSGDNVYQYTLSTAFNVSTASYDSISFSVAGQETTPTGIIFNNDGTKMYIVGSVNDSVYQYTLSTAFDVSTASYDSISFSVAGQETIPTGIAFNNDGTKMYIVGSTGDDVNQYTLSTAFDVSTASYDSITFSVSTQDVSPSGIVFNNDGTKMYMVGMTTDSVYEYTLLTPFDIGTAVYYGISVSIGMTALSPGGIAFNNDGTKMYIVDYASESVFEYPTFDTTLATITYPNSVKFPGGIIPAIPGIGQVDTIGFYTVNGGATHYAYQIGDDHK